MLTFHCWRVEFAEALLDSNREGREGREGNPNGMLASPTTGILW
jgi:hypothetical protein